MDLRILTFLLLFISASAQYCGSERKLKACTCKDKIGSIYSPLITGFQACQWPILADKKNHVVLLESVLIHIGSSKNCSNDYLEVFDGPSVTSPSLGRWCRDGMSVKSSGRDMLVLYRTTGAPNIFKLTYKATAKESSNLGLILGLSIPFGVVLLIVSILLIRAYCCGSEKGTSTGGARWRGGGFSGGGYWGGGGGVGCSGGGGGCGGC